MQERTDMPITMDDSYDWVDAMMNAVRWFLFSVGILAAIGIGSYFYHRDLYPEAARGKTPAELRQALACRSEK